MKSARRTRLWALGIATVALAGTSWLAFQEVTALSRVKAQVTLAGAELSELRNLQPLIEQREQYLREAERIQTMVAAAGLEPSGWTNRQLQRAAVVLPRPDAEKLLRQQIGSEGRQWFAPDYFEVAVLSPGAGLFTPAAPDDRGLSVDMAGVVYFPMRAR